VNVRRATAADAADLAGLSGQFGYPSDESAVRARLAAILARDDHAVFVADESGRAVGWVHVLVEDRVESDRFAEIAGLVVDAARRGHGLGATLVARAEAWAAERGLGAVRVRSNVVRRDAHRFYERLGYRASKRQAVFVKAMASSDGSPGPTGASGR